MRILFDGGLEDMDMAESAVVLLHLLRGLVAANVAYLRRHPETPHPYKAGLRYERERDGEVRDALDQVIKERWLGIAKVLERRAADCEDLASYLAAWELVHHGSASVIVMWRADGKLGRVRHVVTRCGDGHIEDPSRVLGMRAAKERTAA